MVVVEVDVYAGYSVLMRLLWVPSVCGQAIQEIVIFVDRFGWFSHLSCFLIVRG